MPLFTSLGCSQIDLRVALTYSLMNGSRVWPYIRRPASCLMPNFLELLRFLAKEPKKWFAAMQPYLSSWSQFSDLFRKAFLPSDSQEMIWRGILDSVQRPDEPLPTFVTHLVGEFRRLKQPPPVSEQIEIICRHVSDQYRPALHSSGLRSISDRPVAQNS